MMIIQNKYWSALIFLFMLTGLMSCTKSEKEKEAGLLIDNIIPKPVSVTKTGEVFELTTSTGIYVESGSDELSKIGNYLSDRLRPSTGFDLTVASATEALSAGNIYLTTAGGDAQLGEEGYELTVTEELVTLKAFKPAGIFRGIQTIRQLLPVSVERSMVQKDQSWLMPTGTIRDFPKYKWRGSMLDVARHFFSVEDVKRYIDMISYYKMNIFHLGLTNDQGWRIEIKSWPNLATHGGITQVGGGKGGFYTQEQYADLVAYAQSRYITLVPEIDMPGHSNAALASYGELNGGTIVPLEGRVKINSGTIVPIEGQPSTQPTLHSKSIPTELYTGIEVGFSTLRVEKEVTFKFINDVIKELSALTPGPYIHIGGDESHATNKDDYIVFVKKFREIVQANGKIMVGWEEIAQGDIGSDVVTQFWSNKKYGEMAAEKGSKLVMSPSKKVYLDMQYDSTTRLGLHWAAYIEVDSAYNWDPTNYLSGASEENVLGVEAPLWTETISTMDDIEYMLFPRLPGVAEIGWSTGERSWQEYKVRLGNHGARMKAMDIDYYKSRLVPWNDQ